MRTWILVVAAALAGCGDSAEAAPATPVDPGVAPTEKPCSDGFDVMAGEAGCTPILAPSTCAPGTRAAVGTTACVPVGTTVCAPGFKGDASGWGCDAILAPTACASGSGTRERIGVEGCVPVSDCSAPFPPAGATIMVDAAYAPAQLDASHFKTIGEAVAAAPAGATIAVEAGTYLEKIALKKRAVSITGRCAEKVIVKQTDGVIGPAIDIAVGDDLRAKNLTFRGYRTALSIEGGRTKLDSVVIEDGLNAGIQAVNDGADVRLTNVVIRGMKVRSGAQQGFGLYATFGANVVIDDSVFSGNEFVNVAATKLGTKVVMSRSVVRDGMPFGPAAALGMGVYVGESGSAVIEESALVDNSADGLDVYATPGDSSTGVLRRSVVRGTKIAPGSGVGRGIEVTGSHLTIEQSTIRGSAQVEVIATTSAILDITDSTLLGSPSKSTRDRGALGLVTEAATTKARSLAIVASRAGVVVQGTGRLEMDSSLILGTRASAVVYEDSQWVGLGIAVESKASLLLTKSTIQDTHTMGVLVTGKAELEGSLIRGTRGGLDGVGGRALSLQNGGSATIARSSFVDNAETGILALAGSSLAMSGSTIHDTRLDAEGKYGIGLLLADDALATVVGCTVTGSQGVGLAVAAAGASVRRSTISRNAIGVHTQGGTTLMEGDPDGDPRVLLISKDTRFVENATRVGSGVVPLPPAVIGPKTR